MSNIVKTYIFTGNTYNLL